ncbi:EAL domain-containing protein [Vibrio sp. Of7-15]|uniref:bifunctional diguanylate cyclase/phosphodiesterase n=1 Tax=Vibrio sp. Of7-15 TaxID=2724879 RepID=UPI001EF20EC6|nr:EAL domain-containing protein [Vibrio sp. Of7-15]
MTLGQVDYCCYEQNIQQRFPDDLALQELNANGYFGLSLHSRTGELVGILVCLFDKPITDNKPDATWLTHIGHFIGQEIQQQLSNKQKDDLLAQFEKGEQIAGVGSWRWNRKTDIYSMSKEMYRIFDLNPNEKNITLEKDIKGAIHPDDINLFDNEIEKLISGQTCHLDINFRVINKNNNVKVIRKIAEVKHSKLGDILFIEGTVQNITEQYELMKKNELSRYILSQTSEAVLITDKFNKIVQVNNAVEKISGYKEHELLGQDPSILSSGFQSNDHYKNMWATLHKTGSWSGEIWNRHKKGHVYPEDLSINSVKNQQGQITNYIAIFRDITQRKYNEQKLQFLADYEELTGLENRRNFIENLANDVKSSQERNSSLSLIFLDLDNFKYINTTYGHGMGDKLLVSVAERLKNLIGENGRACRYGGDEFAISLPHFQHQQTEEFAKQLKNGLQATFSFDDIKIDITVSLGVAILSNTHESNSHFLLKQANVAMSYAKKNGKNTIVYHNKALEKDYKRKLLIKEKLKQAIKNEKLTAFYQPVYDITTNSVIKYEALARWQDEEEGMISPGEFIPIAEELGLIHLIGNQILHRACQDLKNLHDLGFTHISFSVNRSIKELMRSELEQESILNTITQYGLSTDAIIIEITESIAMSSNPHAQSVIKELKNNGIKIALDDFCTGYSSLNNLIDNEVDIIKIDRSFIKDLETNKSSQILTSTVINLANQLNIEIIAEGVENKSQLDILVKNGCKYIQGFYFGAAQHIESCINQLHITYPQKKLNKGIIN